MRVFIGVFIVLSILVNMSALGQNVELNAGFGYGNGIKRPAFNIRALYKLKNKIDVGADFQFFFKNKSSDEFVSFNVSRKDYSIISRYMYEEIDFINKARFYPILGVGLVNITTSGESNFSNNSILRVEDSRKTYLGLTAGVGGKYEFNTSLSFFGEIKYHHSKESQTMFNVGVIYALTLPFSKSEEPE